MKDIEALATSSPQWDKAHPYPARLAVRRELTTAASDKDVRHFELDLGDSGITWQPGDTVGVLVRNSTVLAEEILAACGVSAASIVADEHYSGPVITALEELWELTKVHPGFIKRYAACSSAAALGEIAANPALMREYVASRQIVDVIKEYPATLTGEQLLSCLRQLMPRQYSIASSQRTRPQTIDLTINMVRYPQGDSWRYGAGSHYLGWQLEIGDPLPLYVVPNAGFRLPADDSIPVIMIGPGTGIAPFRAFLQERHARQARGPNWLFFGNPHRASDFLYGDELLTFAHEGILTQLDLAFSRDHAEKRYVQHLMLEQGEQFYAWLQQGAHVYVCGDAKHMAEDVQQALLAIIESQGGMDSTAARQYLVNLRKAGRYQRDVY